MQSYIKYSFVASVLAFFLVLFFHGFANILCVFRKPKKDIDPIKLAFQKKQQLICAFFDLNLT